MHTFQNQRHCFVSFRFVKIYPKHWYSITDTPNLGSTEDFLRTRRWLGKELKDITTWETSEARRVKLVQNVGDAPISIEVRKFLPIPGDILFRRWHTSEGEKSWFYPPYALTNIQDASKELKRHVEDSVARYIKLFTANESRILFSTFKAIQQAIRHCQVCKPCRFAEGNLTIIP